MLSLVGFRVSEPEAQIGYTGKEGLSVRSCLKHGDTNDRRGIAS